MKKLALVMMISVLSLLILLTSCDLNEDDFFVATEATAHSLEDGHTFGEWITVKTATCQESGQRERVCACGKKEREDIEIVPHQYVNNACAMCGQNDPSVFVPDYAEGEENVVGCDNPISYYTLQADYIYFSDIQSINKVKTDGTGLQTVYEPTDGKVFQVNVLGDWIYFFCNADIPEESYIARVKTNGSDLEKLVSRVEVHEMLVAKDMIYYTASPIDGDFDLNDYENCVSPLFSVSVNGGTPKQIHGGLVTYLVADSEQIYFVHTTNIIVGSMITSSQSKICAMEHGSTSSRVLVTPTENGAVHLSLEGETLYFCQGDSYSGVVTLASVSTNGEDYTVYDLHMANIFQIHVIGSKVYYTGGLENPNNEHTYIVEYDTETKKDQVIMYDKFDFGFAGDYLIFDDYNGGKILIIYCATTRTSVKVRMP